jgi:hypothetical protein
MLPKLNGCVAYRPRISVQMRAIHCKPMLPAVQTFGWVCSRICGFDTRETVSPWTRFALMSVNRAGWSHCQGNPSGSLRSALTTAPVPPEASLDEGEAHT